MAKIWYGHFDSVEGDRRELLADDWAKFIKSFLGDGIRNGGTNLRVSSEGEGMTVQIDQGVAHIQGYIFWCLEDTGDRYYKVEVETAHPSLNRIDRVILRLDRTIQNRTITPEVLLGEAGVDPAPPALTRNKNIYEISLAQIRVPAGAINIRPEYMTDERLDPNVCGIIDSLISADTEQMFKDFTDKFTALLDGYVLDFDEIKLEEKEKFENQLNQQKEDYGEWKGEIDGWKGQVVAEFQEKIGFNFENQIILPGTYKTFEKTGDRILEEIRFTYDNSLLAVLNTALTLEVGVITAILEIYNADGSYFLRTRETTTIINGLLKTEVESL